jgi:hypothetical protein
LGKTVGLGRKGALAMRLGRLGRLGLALPVAIAAGCAGTHPQQGAGESSGLCSEGRSGGHSVGELSALAKVIQSGTRTAMLAGDGLTVRDFVQNLQTSSTGVSVKIYAANGEHVYAPQNPPPGLDSLPAEVRDVIKNGSPTKPTHGRLSFALANEDRCKGCHPSGNIRAVMTLGLTKAPPTPTPDAMIPFGTIVEAAFQAMMTIGKASAADEFMQSLPKEVPGVVTASVFSRDGRASLGDGFMEVPPEIIKRALTPATKPFATEMKDGTLVSVPLPNSHRCLSCHKPSEMRGAIMLKLDPKLSREETAKFLLTSSVQHVMLTGLGRLSKKFLTDATSSGLFSDLTVHDAEGRMFHDMHYIPTPPPTIAGVLRTGKGVVVQGQSKDDLTVVIPVPNDDKCRRCHDDPGAVRAVIAVTGARALGPGGPVPMAHLP